MSNKRYHDPYFGLVKMHRRILFGWDVEVFDGGGGGIVGRDASSSSVKLNGATCVVVIYRSTLLGRILSRFISVDSECINPSLPLRDSREQEIVVMFLLTIVCNSN